MKRICLFVIFIILLIPHSVEAGNRYLTIRQANCTSEGKVRLLASVGCDNCVSEYPSVGLKDLNLMGKYLKTNEDFSVTGKSYDINGKEVKHIGGEYTPWFVSDGTYFSKKGNYELRINSLLLQQPYIIDFSCPGFVFSCDLTNFSIEKCYSSRFYFYMIFKGFGKEQATQQNLNEKLIFHPNLAISTLGYYEDKFPSTYEINRLQGDEYALRVPIEDLVNPIKQITMELKGCEGKYHKRCGKRLFCAKDSDCLFSDEYCNKNRNECNVGERCNDCEILKDGECEPKCKSDDVCKIASCKDGVCSYQIKKDCCNEKKDCDDSLVCTKDLCANNKCTHTEIKCTASDDPCVVGICEEPTGCKYVSNPKCETKEEGMEDITGEAVSEIKKEEEKLSFLKILINWIKSIFS